MDTLKTALLWHSLGISCIPILAGSKRPALETWREYQSRLPRLRELEAWFGGTGYGLAVLTGRGLVVLDFDDAWRYSSWLAGLPSIEADLVLRTYRVQTRRGQHLYFYTDDEIRTTPLDGVDVKAQGGYVLAPPTVHPSGYHYQPIGTPSQIQRVDNLDGLLPELRAAAPCPQSRQIIRDAFDEAMRDNAGVTIEAVKARWTLADLLPVNGNGRYEMVRCPLHADQHASLAVYPDGHWWCYACARGGDVVDLVAAMNDLTIAEALREMAR